MGFGLPAAMAAKLIKLNKQVVAVVGDGGLQMVLADLLTATRYELDITVVVLNNESLQMERDKIQAEKKKEIGVDLTNPDFMKLAEACGWKGFRVVLDTELETVLEEAFNTNAPTLVDISTAQVFFPETQIKRSGDRMVGHHFFYDMRNLKCWGKIGQSVTSEFSSFSMYSSRICVQILNCAF